MRSRGNKFGVSAPEQRTWNHKTYDSKAECEYAQVLDMMQRAGDIIAYYEQVKVELGVRENVYRVDFLVVPNEGMPHFVDVKGVETAKFKRDCKLWRSYGRLDLVVVKRTGPGRFTTMRTIKGDAA